MKAGIDLRRRPFERERKISFGHPAYRESLEELRAPRASGQAGGGDLAVRDVAIHLADLTRSPAKKGGRA